MLYKNEWKTCWNGSTSNFGFHTYVVLGMVCFAVAVPLALHKPVAYHRMLQSSLESDPIIRMLTVKIQFEIN